jgi:3-oxoacyl-[acyl-carrier-protein] synthase I
MRPLAEIVGVGIECAVGLNAAPAAAAIRAGISRVAESRIFDKYGEPLVMGLVPDDLLSPLVNGVGEKLSPWRSRLVQLATRPLLEAFGETTRGRAPIPLLLGAPEAFDGHERALIDLIYRQTGDRVDRSRSQVIARGRAAGLATLGPALRLLETQEAEMVLVGGVDSYLESTRLRLLDKEGRLKTGPVSDGFIPGEGAAFALLAAPGTSARAKTRPWATILGVGFGRELGHMYGSEPYRGDGLSGAFRQVFDVYDAPPVQCVYCTFNGESFWAKEWGVAFVRSKAHFAEPLRFEHPADCIGDAGAGLGAILLGLAAVGLQRGYRQGPCLVFGSSDHDLRVAVLLVGHG